MTDHRDVRHASRTTREIKFLLDASTADTVRRWARAHLTPDAYGGGPSRDEYTTSTLYFDTPAFDVYYRRGSFGRSKYRVRRYGASDVVFFERKLRTSDLLVKRRTAGGIDELAMLSPDATPASAWAARWFERRLRRRGLQPVCRVSYHRMARVGATAHGPMRLTLDDHLTAAATAHIGFAGGTTTPVAPGQVILEFKYRGGIPAIFQALMTALSLTPQPVSKYRLAVAALGCAPPVESHPVSSPERT